MPKFKCKCGNVLNLSIGWSDYELLLLPQSAVEGIGDKIESGELKTEKAFYAEMDRSGVTVYKCPVCDRIYVERGVIALLDIE